MIKPMLFALLLPGQAAPHAKATYSDPALHLTFAYPAELTAVEPDGGSATPSPGQTAKGSTGSVLGCISIPLYVAHQQSEERYELLTMHQIDFDCLKSTAANSDVREFAATSAKAGLTGMGKLNTRPLASYALEQHSAVYAEASATEDGGTAYAGTACVTVGHNALCWTALSQSRAKLREILTGPLAFDGRPGQPLVPAKFLEP